MSPAVVISHSSPGSSKDLTKPGRRSESASAQPRPRKSRIVKRRGRGRPGIIDSDEEIERETMTDVSDSDEPESGSDSETDSDSESLALQDRRNHPDTPSTTQSPPPGEVEAAATLNGFTKPESSAGDASQEPRSAPAFLSPGVDWSDMVASGGSNDAAPLPVIDFSELREHAGDGPPHLTNQTEAGNEEEKLVDASTRNGPDEPVRGGWAGSRGALRSVGQSARQAYQQRLQTDPSFVPTVGEFWSHDDRLLQKDLRGLSPWWRGRWQGRGRGRGGFVGRGFRGRGRGAFFGGLGHVSNGEVDSTAEAEPFNAGEDLLPVEKPWTHDGFEEMRVKEERRRAQKRAAKNIPTHPDSTNGRINTPSRGGFAPRGRGSFRVTSSPTPSRASYIHRLRSQPDRPWYTMKPEHVWTKQFEGYLFSDPSLKPKPGKPAGYRVHLPGKGTEVIRAPVPQKTTEEMSELRSQPPSEMMVPTDVGSRTIVVKLPKPSTRQEPSHTEESVEQAEPVTTAEDLPVELPAVVPAREIPYVTQPDDSNVGPSETYLPTRGTMSATPALTRDNSWSEKSFANVSGTGDQTTQVASEDDKRLVDIPPISSGSLPPPPIQTSFPPPLQPTPSYSPSPFGYPPLPPGIALNQQGFAYEVASGRPVYLQPTPPPQMQMYTPRPMPFVPGHMHHHSLSGDFTQGPPTPPINGILDPSTGQPIFALPRQSSRIEIRAPSDSNEGQMRGKRERGPSSLRSMTVAEQNREARVEQDADSAQPGFGEYPLVPGYYQQGMMSGIAPQPAYQSSEGAGSMSPGSEAPANLQQPSMDQAMMGYPPYQQQYYYPEQYYPAYVEMPQQPGQYDPYNMDPRQQPPVYY